MNEIGGYFELELHMGEEYHTEAIRLNLGRNAFEYILSFRGYRKVFLPYYTCDVMLEPINKLMLDYEFYNINELLEPIFNFNNIGKNETFVYTNYFGIKAQTVKKLSKICSNLIIDNSQAFFEKPINKIDTFYSPRKFFGVPDGAYLYCDNRIEYNYEQAVSINMINHLIGRIEFGAETAYNYFKENEENFKNQPIRRMSRLTQRLLEGIDYIKIRKIRRDNFLNLHKQLFHINMFKINLSNNEVPMVYPFLCETKGLKKYLHENKIFVATYWPNVLESTDKYSIEYRYAAEIVFLPIDQRYSNKEMNLIVNLIIKFANGKMEKILARL